MSQQPPRGGPGSFQGPTPWTPSGQQTSPSPFRPVSAPSPSPQQFHQQQQARGPIQPRSLPQFRDPMSPGPIGMPLSPGMPPAFGVPHQQGGPIQCPMPRWPSPLPASNNMPRPYIPVASHQFTTHSPASSTGYQSPVPCGPPEYLIAPYRPGQYEFVGVPLEPSRAGGSRSGIDRDEVDSGPSTAEIIASQSQDYVDEELAKYQATIHQLQGE